MYRSVWWGYEFCFKFFFVSLVLVNELANAKSIRLILTAWGLGSAVTTSSQIPRTMLREYRALYVDLCVDSYSCNSTNSWVRGFGRDFMNCEVQSCDLYEIWSSLDCTFSSRPLGILAWMGAHYSRIFTAYWKKKENRNSILVQIIYLPTYSALADIRESSKTKNQARSPK